jgi:hypothetical protein
MRLVGLCSVVVLLSCFPSTNGTDAFAAAATPPAAKPKKPKQKAPALARPTGPAGNVDPANASYGGSKIDTITETRNELGQTIYSIVASHFDVSPPLREMAAAALPGSQSFSQRREEIEPPANPPLPPSRILRSDLPDPVVQVVPSSDHPRERRDTRGTHDGLQFLWRRHRRCDSFRQQRICWGRSVRRDGQLAYQIWSLNRATHAATSVLGPSNINTIWSGFGGACEVHNNGDPIVIYDKTARRWLIAQLTGGSAPFYECVALSTSQDATGSYARYAFLVPNALFGDYPKYGAWPPSAYFMSGMAYPPFQAMFAALDRTKMLAADPDRHVAGDLRSQRGRSLGRGSRRVSPYLPPQRRAFSFPFTRTASTSIG